MWSVVLIRVDMFKIFDLYLPSSLPFLILKIVGGIGHIPVDLFSISCYLIKKLVG